MAGRLPIYFLLLKNNSMFDIIVNNYYEYDEYSVSYRWYVVEKAL